MSTSPLTSRLVTAVVVTYQSARTIRPALEALRRSHDAGLVDLVVVDNGSTDGTVEILQQEAPWARLVLTGRNNGFGRGCNLGFADVGTPFSLFVNPDAVVEPDAVRAMLTFLKENEKAGIVGPAILEGDGSGAEQLQMAGARPTPGSVVRAATPLLRHRALAFPIVPGSPPVRTEWVCGAVLMIRSGLMRQLGGFDPRFFLYWEEMDLCRRAEASGFETWAVGAAVASHVGGASSASDDSRVGGCIAEHYYQSRYHYMTKHHGWLAATGAELAEYGLLLARTFVDGIRGRGLQRMGPRRRSRLLSLPERS